MYKIRPKLSDHLNKTGHRYYEFYEKLKHPTNACKFLPLENRQKLLNLDYNTVLLQYWTKRPIVRQHDLDLYAIPDQA